MRFSKPLAVTDLSNEANTVVREAGHIATAAGVELTLLHVVDLGVLLPNAPILLPPEREARLRQEVRQHVTASLQKVRENLLPEGLHCTCVVEEATSVGHAICEYADTHGHDLIVIGSHGRSGFSHLLLGSVAERVLRCASVPVLVVPVR